MNRRIHPPTEMALHRQARRLRKRTRRAAGRFAQAERRYDMEHPAWNEAAGAFYLTEAELRDTLAELKAVRA